MAEIPDPARRDFLLGRFNAGPRADGPLVAVIGPLCLAFRGVTCMTCRDACSLGAVRFELALGGARPWVDAGSCTGCGDCAQACPAQAVRLAPLEAAS